MKFFVRLGRWLDDWMNPIVVKELRQAVRARFIMGLMLLFLLGLLVTMMAVVSGRSERGVDYEEGRRVFMVLYGILVGTCTILVPAYGAGRLMAERTKENTDLLFVSTLKARSIIWGKFCSGLVLSALIFSACMPFLTMTYLLRGLELSMVFALLAIGFLVSAAAIQFALFVACVPTNKPVKGLLCLIAFGLVSVPLGYFIAGVRFLVMYGDAFLSVWRLGLFVLVFSVLTTGFFLVASIAVVSPFSSNRTLPLRVFVTAGWLATGIAALIWSRSLGDDAPLFFWVYLSIMGLCMMLLVGVSERDEIGPRVARQVPRHVLLRPPAFLFYSGSAGGVAWAMLLLVATLAVGAFGADLLYAGWTERLGEALVSFAGFALYAFCYAMTAYVIRRLFFPRMPNGQTWALALCVAALGFLVSVLGEMIVEDPWNARHDNKLWQLGTPLLLSDGDLRVTALVFSATWAAVLILIAGPWFLAQIRQFKPYRAEHRSGQPATELAIPVEASDRAEVSSLGP